MGASVTWGMVCGAAASVLLMKGVGVMGEMQLASLPQGRYRPRPFDQGEPVELLRRCAVEIPRAARSAYSGAIVNVCLFRAIDDITCREREDVFTDSRFAEFAQPQFVLDVHVRRALVGIRQHLFDGLSGAYYFQQALPAVGDQRIVWYRGERHSAFAEFDLRQYAQPIFFFMGEMLLLFYV